MPCSGRTSPADPPTWFTATGQRYLGAEVSQFTSSPPGDGWDQVERDVMGILEMVLAGFLADPARVYLTGVSYGGWGTWFLASRHPDAFAAISPIAGILFRRSEPSDGPGRDERAFYDTPGHVA